MRDMRTVPGNSEKEITEGPSGLSCTPHKPFEVQEHTRLTTTPAHEGCGDSMTTNMVIPSPKKQMLVSLGI